MHFLPASDIHGKGHWEEGKADEHDEQHFPERNIADAWL